MKIRHVLSTNGRLPKDPVVEPASGVVGSALSLAEQQAREGNSVEVWGWNDIHQPPSTKYNRIEIWTSRGWSWARFARWDLRWLAPIWHHSLTKPHVDVLHTYVDPNLLYTPGASVRLLHLQTPVPDPFPRTYQRLLSHADAVICCSEFIRKHFLSASSYPANRTFVVYNGADLHIYDTADGYSQRAQWGFKKNDFVVLYTGAVVPEKGVSQLVRAFSEVQSAVPNAVLSIAGSARLWALPDGNPAGDKYEMEVRKLAQDHNILFLGNIPRQKMPATYLAADIIVVPSVWDDPHPTVVCEAMAAGRPVVASRAGGITETVKHGQTGILVDPGDEAQLSEALITLAQRQDLRIAMGRAARERAELFSWEASARRLDGIYRKLLSLSESPRPQIREQKKGKS